EIHGNQIAFTTDVIITIYNRLSVCILNRGRNGCNFLASGSGDLDHYIIHGCDRIAFAVIRGYLGAEALCKRIEGAAIGLGNSPVLRQQQCEKEKSDGFHKVIILPLVYWG